jgi:hypothetical protein
MVLNKLDCVTTSESMSKAMESLKAAGLPVGSPFLVSALKGLHLGDLREALVKRAKPGEVP